MKWIGRLLGTKTRGLFGTLWEGRWGPFDTIGGIHMRDWQAILLGI